MADDVEERALDKLRKTDPKRWETLFAKVCRCAPRSGNAFTSSVQRLDLQSYDKFST